MIARFNTGAIAAPQHGGVAGANPPYRLRFS